MFVRNLCQGLTGAIVWLALVAPVSAATVTVRWNPNPEPDVTNYNVYVRTQFSAYGPPIAVGNRTNWTFVNLQDNVQHFFAVEAQNPEGVSPRVEIGYYTAANLPGSEASRSDFNGDGWFDILFQHQTNGQLVAWHLNSTAVISTEYLSTTAVALEWRMSGTGDFNKDGKADIIWHNTRTGQVVYWFMNGVFDWSAGYLPGPVSPEWHVASVRDFDLDGNPDIWWYNELTGEMLVWYFDGVTLLRTATPSPGRIADLNWQLAGTADFTGDGRPDALWHNQATGELRVWQLIDINHFATHALNPMFVGTGWKIAALGDANLDGSADILWRDEASGGLVLWTMDGLNQTGGAYLSIPVADPNWKIMAPK
jgi:hypothetical protein